MGLGVEHLGLRFEGLGGVLESGAPGSQSLQNPLTKEYLGFL